MRAAVSVWTLLCQLGAVSVLVAAVRGSTLYVDSVLGRDVTGCGVSTGTASCQSVGYTTSAVASYSGDTVVLALGTYTGPNNLAITWDLKPLTIRCVDWGASGGCILQQRQVFNTTTYDNLPYAIQLDFSSLNASTGADLAMQNGLSLPSPSTLIGLSFVDGDLAVAYVGPEDGSILATLTISNCSFINNRFDYYQPMINILPAFYSSNSAQSNTPVVTIDSCTFTNNTFSNSQIFVSSITTHIRNCNFHPTADGAVNYNQVLSIGNLLNLTVTQCTFEGQTGGISYMYGYYWSGSPTAAQFFDTQMQFIDCVFEGAVSAGGSPVFTLSQNVMVTFLRCQFVNNRNLFSSGGVLTLQYLQTPSSVLFDSCTFINNSANSGGVIVSYDVAPDIVRFLNCTFVNNLAVVDAGGVLFEQGLSNIDFDQCLFANNMAQTQGGAVVANPEAGSGYGFTTAVLSFHRCQFMNNTAQQGGAVFASYLSSISTVILSDSVFKENTASSTGGALYLLLQTNTTLGYAIQGTAFSNNRASTGGAIYLVAGSTLSVDNSTWSDNYSQNGGGALYIENGASVAISRSVMERNTAAADGGAVYSRMSDVTFDSTSFTNNSAVLGGALYFVAAPLVLTPAVCLAALENVTFSGNSATKIGGAFYAANMGPIFSQLCGGLVNANWTSQQATAHTDNTFYRTSLCTFSNNRAGLVYGNNFGTTLASIQMVSTTPSLQSSPVVEANNSVSVRIYPGLSFGVAASAIDSLGRLLSLSNGGYYGVLLAVRLMPIVNGTISADVVPLTGLVSLPVASGVVAFTSLVAFSPPTSDQLSYQLWISSDPTSNTLILPVTVAPCPTEQGYVVISSSPYTCGPRPVYVAGDNLSVSVSFTYVLFSVAICMLGVWTSMFLVEQAIVSRSRKSPHGVAALQQMWSVWSTLAALCFAVVGIWCSQVIGLSIIQVGFSYSALDIQLHASLLYTSLALLIVLPVVCYWLLLTNETYATQMTGNSDDMGWAARANHFRGNLIFKQMDLSDDLQSQTRALSTMSNDWVDEPSRVTDFHAGQAFSDENRDQEDLGDQRFRETELSERHRKSKDMGLDESVVSASANADVDRLETGGKRSKNLPASASVASENGVVSPIGESRAAASSNETPQASKPRTNGKMNIGALIKKQLKNWRVVAGVLSLWMTVVVGDLLACASVQPASSTPTFSPGQIIVCLLCSLALFVPAMLAYLFYFRAFRLACVAMLTCSRSIFFVSTLCSMTWKYNDDSHPSPWTSNADLFSSSSLNLAVFVVALLTCAACMVLNIKALKLSHHELAATLYKMAQHSSRQARQIVQLEAGVRWLNTVVTLNSTLRPLAAEELIPKIVGSDLTSQHGAEEPMEVQPGKVLPLSELCSPMLAASLVLADVNMKEDLNDGLAGLIARCSVDSSAKGTRDEGSGQLPGSTAGRDKKGSEVSTTFLSLQPGVNPLSKLAATTQKQPLPLSLTLLRHFSLLPQSDSYGVTSTRLAPVDLSRILAHPVCCELFKDYSVSTHNGESVLFCCAVAQYRHCPPGTDQQHLHAVVIYHTFVTDGSKHECNISSIMKAVIRERIQGWARSSGKQRRRVFDESMDEVVRLVQTNLWQGFTRTTAYQLCQLLLASAEASHALSQHAEQ